MDKTSAKEARAYARGLMYARDEIKRTGKQLDVILTELDNDIRDANEEAERAEGDDDAD